MMVLLLIPLTMMMMMTLMIRTTKTTTMKIVLILLIIVTITTFISPTRTATVILRGAGFKFSNISSSSSELCGGGRGVFTLQDCVG